VKIPGPDHPITLEPATKRWRAKFAGHVIADTAEALILREASYPPRVYFPRGDVAMDYMSRTDRSTNCPYKGDATYYTLLMDGQFAENAVWTYEEPYPHMAEIAGRLSFYPDKIEVYEAPDTEADAEAEAGAVRVDEVVQHTDSGSGNSQLEHWPANTNDVPR
jgi:uncharacterized protein (DUF427 family)